MQMNLPISGDNGFFLDLYSRYSRDPGSVPADWRLYFETMDLPDGSRIDHALLGDWLAMAYRTDGHRTARLDPLGLAAPAVSSSIETARRLTSGRNLRLSIGGAVQDLSGEAADARLAALYCGSASLQASHLDDAAQREWLWHAYEIEIQKPPGEDELARALEAVLLADAFERTVKTKWPTKKRFGSEGAEGSLVFLREAFHAAAGDGCREIVIGGMHRGRLAALATVFGKSLPALIAEIKGKDVTTGDADFTGDVPYHNGLRSSVHIAGRALDVRVLPHPSHLTVVAPVAMGAARARRELRTDGDVLALMMHTDAAFAGQGLVSELLQLDGLAGYTSGGTIHLVVNNQIGFTTLPQEGRSTHQPTDIGRAYGLPIFHVNGDDPAAVAAVARVAVAWRNHSGRGAIINFVCYRRYGHNELDEPRFTQPTMWGRIDAQVPLADSYGAHVRAVSPEAARKAEIAKRTFAGALDLAFTTTAGTNAPELEDETITFLSAPMRSTEGAATGVPTARLKALAALITAIPQGFDVDPKVQGFYKARRDSVVTEQGINMATAEALAFATLLSEGTSVRLSGQDAVRGTFTQRHIAIHDRSNGARCIPLLAATKQGARFDAINSPLSEYGVLSFEYGASLADPDRLFVWEAQFGDFLNGAQITVDQFIATAEAKWRIPSSLVIALPHGLEGQGPDHSSARIERLLQCCANDNLRVANPTTPANLFHLLRRQIIDDKRKPLFLIAPKSLLRDKAAASKLVDFGEGTSFRTVIAPAQTGKARRLILCSGKFFYALEAVRHTEGLNNIRIARVEQLYPFPETEFRALLAAHPKAELLWCQEEPRNQGAYSYVRDRLSQIDAKRALGYAGREYMAAAAGGSIERHEHEQARIIATALGI
jgi:2-oxoglutarate dehydrogenase E1 component